MRTGQPVAVKLVPRGPGAQSFDAQHITRELLNHRMVRDRQQLPAGAHAHSPARGLRSRPISRCIAAMMTSKRMPWAHQVLQPCGTVLHVASQSLMMCPQVGRHPNIVQLLEVFPTEHHLAIVMEFAAGGDLSELIDARGSQDVSHAGAACCMAAPGNPASGAALRMPLGTHRAAGSHCGS